MSLRIGIISDLHREWWKARHEEDFTAGLRRAFADCPLVLLAGDLGGVEALGWAARAFPWATIVAVAGNHDLYGHRFDEGYRLLAEEAARHPNLRFLEKQEAVLEIGGRRLRVLGTTLWTDYALVDRAMAAIAMSAAREVLDDFEKIAMPDGSPLDPEFVAEEHARCRAWLIDRLAEPFDGETVVLVHHAPSERSLDPTRGIDGLAAAFASRLDNLVGYSGAALLVHGHTHHDADYELGATRVVARQFGYVMKTKRPPEGLTVAL